MFGKCNDLTTHDINPINEVYKFVNQRTSLRGPPCGYLVRSRRPLHHQLPKARWYHYEIFLYSMNISYIYTFIHIYMYTYTYTYMYIYISISIYTHTYTHIYIYMGSGASPRAVELTKVLNSHPLRRVGLVLDQ